jgi:hypothetical protein
MAKLRKSTAELDKLRKTLQTMGAKAVKVGVLGSDGSDIVQVATFNEYGTQNIPERSFIRSTMTANQAKYAKGLKRAFEAVLDNRIGPEQALGLVGLEVQKDIQARITELRDPPNADATVAAKGSSNPLIDTGRLRQSVTFDVVTVKPEDRKK